MQGGIFMRLKSVVLSSILVGTLLVGCGTKPGEENLTQQEKNTQQQQNSEQQNAQPDVVASPSIVSDEDSLHRATSKDGSWIIILKRDFEAKREIVLEGEFTKKDTKDPSKQVPAGRKIALYDQDQNRNKTASYTLTAPKLIVRSEDARIQGGTFVGDVYVESKGFSIVDAKVQGNVYFASEELKATFKLESNGSVIGVTEVKK